MLDTLWLIFTQSYFDITTRYLIGFLAAVGCFAITSWYSKYVGSNPRLFTVLALFAGVWVAIALMYEQTPWTSSGEAPKNSKAFRPNDVAGDLASFIMVFVGTLLPRTPQSDFMALSLAALKLILAFTFCRLVVQHAKNPVSES